MTSFIMLEQLFFRAEQFVCVYVQERARCIRVKLKDDKEAYTVGPYATIEATRQKAMDLLNAVADQARSKSDAHGWKYIKDEQPQEGAPVLVYDHRETYFVQTFVGTRDGDRWYITAQTSSKVDPAQAWMLLPKTPMGGKL